jgi:lantibiotic biosynthesis protein
LFIIKLKDTVKNFNFHSNFIYRTPRLPVGKNKISVEELFSFSKETSFKEAIYLASPVLYDEMIKWHKGELTEEKEIEKLYISLFKYYTRMQTRCTPYGLFAACSSGEWKNENKIILDDKPVRHTRLDMNYLCALAQKLNSHPAILPLLKFYPNNSIYEFGDTLRYVEYKYINTKRVHQISSVDYTNYLKTILDKAQNGASANELAALLIDDEITREDADAFLKELIQTQLLVSELEPAVTGEEFIFQIIEFLKSVNKNFPEINSIIELLSSVQQKIDAIDEQVENNIDEYRSIYERLKMLETPIEENQLFQTDLFKTAGDKSLDTSIQAELSNAIDFLNQFSNSFENPNLKKFRENFYNQYEDAEISLLEVLDTETGIGYTGKDTSGVNPLLDDVYFPGTDQQSSSEMRWNKQQQFLHDKLIHAGKNNLQVVSFTDEEIKDIGKSTSGLPDTIPVMFRLIDDKNKIHLLNCGGSSAANLLGRFAHGDKQIHSIINDITTHEQKIHSDKILAEIVHLPESRVGNILLRPILRNYEIPYLGKSALPVENQILLQDLMVSVKGRKIILRSKKLNKEIIPRLSSAHNYSYNALPVYQFLCDLQTQYYEKASLGFNWGNLSRGYKFLPRAEYKNVVLERAKWQLAKADYEFLFNAKCTSAEINEWRKNFNIPALTLFVEGDNELLINFEDELSVKMFVSSIKKRSSIILEEFLFDINNLLIKDKKQNGYTHEFIAILLKKEIQSEQAINSGKEIPAAETQQDLSVERNFSIGSEWLYYKFYSGIKTADKLLAEVIRPLTEQLLEKKLIDHFFFIRYSDPDIHIRLRFHISDPKNLGPVILAVNKSINSYLEMSLITKIQTDTYKRELERYGANTIEAAEQFFYIDSIATLNLLDLIDGEEGEDIRWQFAVRSIDELLTGFGYTSAEKLNLLESLKSSFIQEHGGSKELKLQLDSKFRNVRKKVEDILDRTIDNEREILPLIELLEWKKEQLAPVVSTILEHRDKGKLQIRLNDLMASYIHMMLNRIFKARQRTFELVVYDLLYRNYKSLAGREKSKKNTNMINADL